MEFYALKLIKKKKLKESRNIKDWCGGTRWQALAIPVLRRQRWGILGACWLTNLMGLMRSRFCDRPSVKN